MSARTAPARTRAGARSAAPAFPRRVSGPVRRPIRGGAVALPAPRTRVGSRFGPLADRLIRSRACIWLIGLALMGVVAMQVSLLKMNAGISRAVESSTTLERQNAALEAKIARLSSQERIRAAATDLGMISPNAGSVGFVTVRPGVDAARAARRIQPPSDAARALMRSGGVAAAAPAADTTTTGTTTATTTTSTPTTTAPPTATATAEQAPAVQPQEQVIAAPGTP